MGRESNDGKDVEYGSDGRVESVGGSDMNRGMSGTAGWDDDGNRRDDSGPSSDTRGDKY